MTNGFEGPRNTNDNGTSHDIPDIHQEGVSDPQAQPIREHEVNTYADQLGAAPSGIPPKGERDSDRTAKKEKKSYKKGIIGTIGGVATAAVAAGVVLLSQGGSSEANNAPNHDPSQPVATGVQTPGSSHESHSPAPEKKTGVPESYPSLATLTKEAKTSPEKFMQEPIQYRLYWASSVEKAVDKSMLNTIDPTVASHYQRNPNPSVKDDAQTILDDQLVFGNAAAHGFMSWIDVSDGTALRNNDKEGESYYSTIWNTNNPDNVRRIQGTMDTIKKLNSQTGAYIENTDYIGTATKDGDPLKLDGVGTVPTKIIHYESADGVNKLVETDALVPYVNASGEQDHQWVTQTVTNLK